MNFGHDVQNIPMIPTDPGYNEPQARAARRAIYENAVANYPLSRRMAISIREMNINWIAVLFITVFVISVISVLCIYPSIY
jgi:hypothetical protein